ncbi:MAG: endonuclease/exonuclease/phosphatase family protein [Chitinispirillaceae bacterium]|nr:endonuclease/exonuclease/phosphatase family protein [Chitinispirillaceae bacterium]
MKGTFRYYCLCLLLVFVLIPAYGLCSSTISICSFNIQFLGNSKQRQNGALADIVKDYDVVAIQELVAPPYPGVYPDGTPYSGDPEAAVFFDEMKARGFEYILSEEDTGSGTKIHNNGSATEWWVAFYKPDVVDPANDLPHGFLDKDRSDNPNFERVPYAFGFRAIEGSLDFVLVSVHLQPDTGFWNEVKRSHELDSIARWIDLNGSDEKDFIIVGDMNIQNKDELGRVIPRGFISMNENCLPTNTNIKKPKPYDHVMYRPTYTQMDIDSAYPFKVGSLVDEMKVYWDSTVDEDYPGTPYQHNKFRKYFSDHQLVSFQMIKGMDLD